MLLSVKKKRNEGELGESIGKVRLHLCGGEIGRKKAATGWRICSVLQMSSQVDKPQGGLSSYLSSSFSFPAFSFNYNEKKYIASSLLTVFLPPLLLSTLQVSFSVSWKTPQTQVD